jgi:uncharacterized protein with NRDE domain
MCLVVFAAGVSERWPLALAANRDERHDRPTLRAAWWPDRAGVFGGRDLVAHGSWLAADRTGRIAAVTNLPPPGRTPAPRSRGALVADYVGGARSLDSMLALVAAEADAYGPFNLLLLDGTAAAVQSNRAPGARRLDPGVHALGNALLGMEWPKLAAARTGMRAALASSDPAAALLDLLAQRAAATSDAERYRSSIFIDGPEYGTRSSTVILRSSSGELTFVERSFAANGRLVGEVRETFAIDAPLRASARA